jgi:hypothetical protein
MAKLLRTDGTVDANYNIDTLDKMQHAVGGLIELVYRGDKIIIVNEEGMLLGLPVNERASELADYPIVGPAIVAYRSEVS